MTICPRDALDALDALVVFKLEGQQCESPQSSSPRLRYIWPIQVNVTLDPENGKHFDRALAQSRSQSGTSWPRLSAKNLCHHSAL